jgi:hypothetical protein
LTRVGLGPKADLAGRSDQRLLFRQKQTFAKASACLLSAIVDVAFRFRASFSPADCAFFQTFGRLPVSKEDFVRDVEAKPNRGNTLEIKEVQN